MCDRYEKSREIGPLHTGGPVTVSYDGSHIVTCVEEIVVLTRISDGEQICRYVSVSFQIFYSVF